MTENNIRNIPILKEFRRKLRKNMTPAEIALWQHLKAGKLNGTHWRRQYSVDKYIWIFIVLYINCVSNLMDKNTTQCKVIKKIMTVMNF